MLKLMKTMFAALLVGFLLQAVQFTASAIPITGELNMGGAAVLNNSSLSSATGVTSFLGVRANSASTGVFAEAEGLPAHEAAARYAAGTRSGT